MNNARKKPIVVRLIYETSKQSVGRDLAQANTGGGNGYLDIVCTAAIVKLRIYLT